MIYNYIEPLEPTNEDTHITSFQGPEQVTMVPLISRLLIMRFFFLYKYRKYNVKYKYRKYNVNLDYKIKYPRGHGVSGSTLSSLKQGQGFDPFLCMKNLSWRALYPSVGRPGASVDQSGLASKTPRGLYKKKIIKLNCKIIINFLTNYILTIPVKKLNYIKI